MATDLAFALAGLGGFNAHGAGFLTAARELNVAPDLITATSGQIIVLSEWLQHHDLKALLIDPRRPAGPLGTFLTAVSGDPGIFRPAAAEYWRRWQAWPRSLSDFSAALFPAQEYVPLRSEAFFRDTADQLNGAAFGVVFNAYDPWRGEGVLFGNSPARALLPDAGLEPIAALSVASALWLSLYGFENMPDGKMDGAYHRSCIVAELQGFRRIYAVRPLAEGWRGKAPESWFDVQDWQLEMWFSASYRAEVADMKRINKLIRGGYLTHPKYREIDLIEVPVDHPAGYFNYFTERPEVFDAAYAEAKRILVAPAAAAAVAHMEEAGA
jgi:hypothetical protein